MKTAAPVAPRLKAKLKKKREAPYLTIAGRPARVGQVYYTVHRETGLLTKNIAHYESNVITQCYFRRASEAAMYSNQVKLRNFVIQYLKEIEEKHLGR